MSLDRVQTRLTKPLADHVRRVVGEHGLYPTPSHYLQDLIRRDMESETYQIFNQIVEGYRDMAEDRVIESTGDWEKDKALFAKREAEGWQ
ncbi:MAG: CopG family transcriptional regulator [Cyanobacteria bacterium SBLK]|nr:CopG family transcriptional regulator [Cyanobacteria bacterium SBLK]